MRARLLHKINGCEQDVNESLVAGYCFLHLKGGTRDPTKSVLKFKLQNLNN